MASFLTLYLQILLFSVGPFLLPGLLVWLVRQIFVQLVGTRSGRRPTAVLLPIGFTANLCYHRSG